MHCRQHLWPPVLAPMPRVRAEVFPSIHLHRLDGKWQFVGPIQRFLSDQFAFQRGETGIEVEVAVGSVPSSAGSGSEGTVAVVVAGEVVAAAEGAFLSQEDFRARVEQAGHWK